MAPVSFELLLVPTSSSMIMSVLVLFLDIRFHVASVIVWRFDVSDRTESGLCVGWCRGCAHACVLPSSKISLIVKDSKLFSLPVHEIFFVDNFGAKSNLLMSRSN